MNLKGISCLLCGQPVISVPALEPGYEGGGGFGDVGWWCPDHRQAMKNLMGEAVGQSPGRPVSKSASQLRIEKYRRMSASMRARRESQAPTAPSSRGMAPRMPRPSPPCKRQPAGHTALLTLCS